MLGAIANGIIAGFPGTDQNPDAVVAATGAVFWAVLIGSVLALVAALAMPKTPVPERRPSDHRRPVDRRDHDRGRSLSHVPQSVAVLVECRAARSGATGSKPE